MKNKRFARLRDLRNITKYRDKIFMEKNTGAKHKLLSEYSFGTYYPSYIRTGGWENAFLRLNSGHAIKADKWLFGADDLAKKLWRFYWEKIQGANQ